MKKKIILILTVILMLVGCTKSIDIELNAKKADMSEYVLLKDENHAFLKLTLKESLRLFSEDGTGMLYLGFVNCPWCNRAVPILNDAAKESEAAVYYVDMYGDDVNKEDINILIVNISSLLGEDGSLSVPLVIAIKNGNIVGHQLALGPSYNDYTQDVNEEQYNETKDIYLQLFEKLK